MKLDDGFPTHPKIIKLSDAAFRAHVAGLCYSAQHLTNGDVPSGIAKPKAVTELVERRLWSPKGGDGYSINDYLDYNPSREKVLDDRSKRQASGRAGGQANARAHAKAHAEHPAKAPDSPRPVPSRPVPKTAKQDRPAAAVENPLAEALLDSSSRCQHLLRGIVDKEPHWDEISDGVLMQLGKRYGPDVVITAVAFVSEGELSALKPYPYLESICLRIATERGEGTG